MWWTWTSGISFGQVDREILVGFVGQVVKVRRVLGMIGGWLTAGVLEEGNLRYEVSGMPQGGVISPLLEQRVSDSP